MVSQLFRERHPGRRTGKITPGFLFIQKRNRTGAVPVAVFDCNFAKQYNTEEKIMMKKTVFALFLSAGGILSAATCPELMKEAEALAKAKDVPNALKKYEEAGNAASTSAERLNCILAGFTLLQSNRQGEQALQILRSHLEDEKLENQELRRLVNTYAGQIIWGSPEAVDEAMTLLNSATRLKTGVQYDEFCTWYLMAHIHAARKNYEAALGLMQNILKRRDLHPAIHYSASLFSGEIQEKNGQRESALEYYRKALEFGKKITYKFDYSAAEQAVKRLSK